MDGLRLYQQQCLNAAKFDNVIAFLDTGTGKTKIAINLIHYMLEQDASAKSVFLAPVRELVYQQTEVAQQANLLTKGITGKVPVNWFEDKWARVFHKYQLLVMTPELFNNQLKQGYLQLHKFKLLIIDECHHTKEKHPYNILMERFYHTLPYENRPKVLGLTASPLTDRDLSPSEMRTKIRAFCQTLDCKLAKYDRQSLEKIANRPWYSVISVSSESVVDTNSIIDSLRHLPKDVNGNLARGQVMKHLKLLKKLGSSGFKHLLDELAHKINDIDVTTVLNLVPFGQLAYSNRLETLVDILKEQFSLKGSSQAIILAKQRSTVCFLHKCLQLISAQRQLSIRPGKLIGTAEKSSYLAHMSEKDRRDNVEAFRKKTLNVLVATTVVEEGIDIPSCNLVIRFDGASENLRSYVQSKGRARDMNSKFIILCSQRKAAQTRRDLELFEQAIEELKQLSLGEDIQFKRMKVLSPMRYVVEETGAQVFGEDAIKFLEKVCRNTGGRPQFVKETNSADPTSVRGTRYKLNLPAELLPYPVYSSKFYQNAQETAKIDAALEGIKALREVGVLDNYLRTENERPKLGYSYLIQYVDNEEVFRIDPEQAGPEKALMIVQNLNIYQLTTPMSSQFYIYELMTTPQYPSSSINSLGFLLPFPVNPSFSFVGYPMCLFNYRGITTNEAPSSLYPIKFHLKLVESRLYSSEELQLIKSFHFLVYSLLRPSLSEQHCTDMNVCLVPLSEQTVNWSLLENLSLESEGLIERGHTVQAAHNQEVYIVKGYEPFGLNYQFEDYKNCAYSLVSVSEYFALHHKLHFPSEQVYVCIPLRGFRLMKKPKMLNYPNHLDLLLPVSLCKKVSIPTEILLWAKLSPTIFQRINETFLIDQLSQLLDIKLDYKLGFEAVCASSVLEMVNYERLEKLGDSVLKFMVTDYLFNDLPTANEGGLSTERQKLVCNDFLFTIAFERKFYQYIQVRTINTKEWTPPGMTSKVSPVKISVKQLADIVESLLGAVYYRTGIFGAQQLLQTLGIIQKFTPQELPQVKGKYSTALGYTFKNSLWLTHALTPPDAQLDYNYQRLEFLGDAIIDMITVDYFYRKYPQASQGLLTLLHHESVKNTFLAVLAYETGLLALLDEFGYMDKHLYSEFEQILKDRGGTSYNNIPETRFKQFGDIFEAVLGAIYMDSRNYQYVRDIMLNVSAKYLESELTIENIKNHPINQIQHWGQATAITGFKIKHYSIEVNGTRVIRVEVLGKGSLLARGTGISKYEAAEIALQKLQSSGLID